ncbi:MAG TPA: TIGR04282 family arsenosugar biosynthesis glycosyltransferase [Methyloceanibacter sp.]|nr:TIGR04282 family arsenosugar biosynthesis glycosyltransferase [Methyloceanibacter sp.]
MARRNASAKRGPCYARRLVIMAKRPAMGRVKRRLAREIGATAALRFYRSSFSHTMLRLTADPRWLTVIAMDALADGTRLPSPRRAELMPQGDGDLGVRMQRLFTRLPPGPVVVIGSDIPSIRPAHIALAFRLLGQADAVFGPAPDGGYWLVGLKRTPRVLMPFARVHWSGPHALADTRANLKGKRVALAACLSDVDRAEDLRHERGRAGRLI